jgi:hypothetical protein
MRPLQVVAAFAGLSAAWSWQGAFEDSAVKAVGGIEQIERLYRRQDSSMSLKWRMDELRLKRRQMRQPRRRRRAKLLQKQPQLARMQRKSQDQTQQKAQEQTQPKARAQ